MNREPSLLERLGGEAGCRKLASEFYGRVARSDELRPLFPGKSVRCATEEFAAFLIQFLGGDESQTQYRWWLSLRESHARFKISEIQRTTWLALMHEAIDSTISEPGMRLALEQFFVTSSEAILWDSDAEVHDSELAARWSQQEALERLVAHLVQGRDAESLELAARFTTRRSVMVGILARMMEAGRAPLIEFALASIRQDAELGAARFNGRTLLHFASGHACLPVASLLLEAGVDPNVADAGGHAPLYRAKGAAIVRELVHAGAQLDRGGGTNRSTALHEAARHGNFEVARALIELGADASVRDKKGLTPLDRARNCRRHEVAAYLASVV